MFAKLPKRVKRGFLDATGRAIPDGEYQYDKYEHTGPKKIRSWESNRLAGGRFEFRMEKSHEQKRAQEQQKGGLGFQIQQPTDLQTHLLKAHQQIHIAEDRWAGIAKNLGPNGPTADEMRHVFAIGVLHMLAAEKEINLAISAAATHA